MLLPIKINAQEKQIEYQKSWEQLSPENTLYPLDWETSTRLRTEYDLAQAKLQVKRASHGANYGGQCVTYIKNITGHGGETFGNGGSKLSPLTLLPRVGDVVVFKNPHIAQIIAITDGRLVLTESNLHWDGLITTGRKIAINDPSIKGFWTP